jgi:hypothetical protein
MNTNPRSLGAEVLGRLVVDTDPWLSCDDCFDLVDRYVEQLLAGQPDAMPEMRVHLGGCPACAEEAATLVQLAATDTGSRPRPELDWLLRPRG